MSQSPIPKQRYVSTSYTLPLKSFCLQISSRSEQFFFCILSKDSVFTMHELEHFSTYARAKPAEAAAALEALALGDGKARRTMISLLKNLDKSIAIDLSSIFLRRLVPLESLATIHPQEFLPPDIQPLRAKLFFCTLNEDSVFMHEHFSTYAGAKPAEAAAALEALALGDEDTRRLMISLLKNLDKNIANDLTSHFLWRPVPLESLATLHLQAPALAATRTSMAWDFGELFSGCIFVFDIYQLFLH